MTDVKVMSVTFLLPAGRSRDRDRFSHGSDVPHDCVSQMEIIIVNNLQGNQSSACVWHEKHSSSDTLQQVTKIPHNLKFDPIRGPHEVFSGASSEERCRPTSMLDCGAWRGCEFGIGPRLNHFVCCLVELLCILNPLSPSPTCETPRQTMRTCHQHNSNGTGDGAGMPWCTCTDQMLPSHVEPQQLLSLTNSKTRKSFFRSLGAVLSCNWEIQLWLSFRQALSTWCNVVGTWEWRHWNIGTIVLTTETSASSQTWPCMGQPLSVGQALWIPFWISQVFIAASFLLQDGSAHVPTGSFPADSHNVVSFWQVGSASCRDWLCSCWAQQEDESRAASSHCFLFQCMSVFADIHFLLFISIWIWISIKSFVCKQKLTIHSKMLCFQEDELLSFLMSFFTSVFDSSGFERAVFDFKFFQRSQKWICLLAHCSAHANCMQFVEVWHLSFCNCEHMWPKTSSKQHFSIWMFIFGRCSWQCLRIHHWDQWLVDWLESSDDWSWNSLLQRFFGMIDCCFKMEFSPIMVATCNQTNQHDCKMQTNACHDWIHHFGQQWLNWLFGNLMPPLTTFVTFSLCWARCRSWLTENIKWLTVKTHCCWHSDDSDQSNGKADMPKFAKWRAMHANLWLHHFGQQKWKLC